ncbi:MAG: YceI family protein [Ktedonobacterales bacterium]|nr:YceI family protein [Ktedonobacterales bacterium]
MTSPATIGQTTWELDASHSLVEFSVKHMMVTTVKGRFTGVKGTIVTDMADHSKGSVEVTIDAATVDTRDEKRDGHLKSPDFLDVATFPTITFKSTRVLAQDAKHLNVIGDLTIRGVTKQVELDTELNGEGNTPFGTHIAGFTATTKINRKEFGLNWNVALEAGGFLVSDDIKISIEGEATQK